MRAWKSTCSSTSPSSSRTSWGSPVHRVEEFVGLLQQIPAQRVMGLLALHGPEVRSRSMISTASMRRSRAGP